MPESHVDALQKGKRGITRQVRGADHCRSCGLFSIGPPKSVQASNPPTNAYALEKPCSRAFSAARALFCSFGHVQ